MDRTGFAAWLDRYVDAWRLNDPVAIGDLFSSDVRYAYDPFDEAVVGRAAIVASWLDEPDAPGSWEADYDVLAVDGDVFVAHGRTRYLTDDRTDIDREFANIFVCRFDADGRCREFTEYYMRRRPEPADDEPPAAG
ncbi:MAG TPA: nuclear transport factor 2 family protein [Candidatus Saccharimonadales bacterium]|nr:nuclear transport factor 2 family protein [Candidatus Saccharimonadales bacterium]